MTHGNRPLVGPLLLAMVVAAACRAATGQAAAGTVQADAPSVGGRGHPADVTFMRHMIAHHAQALTMASLVAGRTNREDMKLLAERIAVSQRDEIALMRQWLTRRGHEVPNVDPQHAHHAAPGHEAMPGMASEAELAQLARARGGEFDRLFLELMLRHHEGALTMVAGLFRTPGAAQESEVYQFATDVDADQRAEIARMRALLSRTVNQP